MTSESKMTPVSVFGNWIENSVFLDVREQEEEKYSEWKDVFRC